MANTFRLPAYDAAVPEANRLLQPIMQGWDAGLQDKQRGIENERQNKLMGFRQQEADISQARFGMEKDKARREREGNVALLTLEELDEGQRAQKWQRFMATHPKAATLDPTYHDARTGPLKILGDAGMAQAYLDNRIKQQAAKNDQARLGFARSADDRAAEAHRANMAQYENLPPKERMEAAPALGLIPATPSYNSFVANRKYAPPEAAVKTFTMKPGEEVAGVNTQTGQESWRVRGGEANKSEDKFNEAIATSQAKQFQDAVESYPATQATLGKVQIMKSLSGLIGQPGIANTLANSPVGQAARAVGLAPEQMATLESWTAMVNQMVPSQRPPGSGSMSDRDVELFKSSLPALASTKEGRDFILTQMESIAKYDAQRAQISNEVVTGRLNRKVASDRMMALPNPLAAMSQNMEQFGFKASQDGAPVRVNSPQDAARLPPGTRFIGHDGVERVVR